MQYWNTSTLLKLFVPEPDSPLFAAHLSPSAICISQVGQAEMLRAIARKEAEGGIPANKPRPQDHLHQALLAEFLKFEFCADLEKPATLEVRDWLVSARTVKTANLNFFENDERLKRRLSTAISKLTATEHRTLKHWAKHHLPGYAE